MQENLQTFIKDNKRWIPLAAAVLAVILALIIWVGVTETALGDATQKNDRVLLALGQKAQSELVFTLRTYDGIYKADADFDGAILPAVRRHLNTVIVISDILVNGYGAEYAVIPQDLRNRLDHFYAEYELAQKAGHPTTEALTQLDGCMHDLETIVLTRFEDNGALILN